MKHQTMNTEQQTAHQIAAEVATLLQPQIAQKDWLTETEALQLLGGISNKTLYKITSGGKITYSKITGRHRLYSRRSIMRYIESKSIKEFR